MILLSSLCVKCYTSRGQQSCDRRISFTEEKTCAYVRPPARRRMTWSSRGSSEKCGILLAHSTKVKSCLSAAWQMLVTGSLVWGGNTNQPNESLNRHRLLMRRLVSSRFHANRTSSGTAKLLQTEYLAQAQELFNTPPSGPNLLPGTAWLRHITFSMHSVYSKSGLYVWFIQSGQRCLLSCWGFLRYTSPFSAPRPVQHRGSCPQACPRWNCW